MNRIWLNVPEFDLSLLVAEAEGGGGQGGRLPHRVQILLDDLSKKISLSRLENREIKMSIVVNWSSSVVSNSS